MSFIDSTYFIGEINVSNASSDTHLSQAITLYEKEFLILLLGYELYALLMADLAIGTPQTQKYIDLVNGAEFTHEYNDQEITLKWDGLINELKQSPIAHYVFFKYVERDITPYYGAGMSQVPKGKDFEKVNPVPRLASVWERMRDMYGRVPIGYKNCNYPILGSEIGYTFNNDPSAFNFLFANKDDYPTWRFTPLWNINVFGI